MTFLIFAACAWMTIVFMSLWFRIRCIDHLRSISRPQIEPDPTIFNRPTRKFYNDVLFGRYQMWTKNKEILSDFKKFRYLIIIQLIAFTAAILIGTGSSLM
jgi:hypothetical protein